jgi:hypothetical protein
MVARGGISAGSSWLSKDEYPHRRRPQERHFYIRDIAIIGSKDHDPHRGRPQGSLPYGYNARACCEDSCAGGSVVKALLVQ